MKLIIIAILLLIMIYCLLCPRILRNEYLDNPPPPTPPPPAPSGGSGGNASSPAPIPSAVNEAVIDNIKNNITALQNKLEQAMNQLTALKAQVTSNTSNIDLVQQTVNTINTLISNLQTHIASGK